MNVYCPNVVLAMSPKILFLSISEYSGHRQATRAMIGALKKYHRCHTSEDINFFHLLPRCVVRWIDGAYYRMIGHKPSLWASLRSSQWVKKIMTPFAYAFFLCAAIPFYRRFIKGKTVQAIVCTQSFPCACVSLLKAFRLYKGPLIAVITDYDINPYWICRYVDKFVIAHSFLARQLISEGIASSKIKPYGIPIAVGFSEQDAPSPFPVETSRYTVLIMGGALGFGRMEDMVAVLSQEPDIAIIVVTGANQTLYDTLIRRYHDRAHIQILGFVDTVPKLMCVADMLVCKPGGLTVSEALHTGVHLVVMDPISGQEEANQDFLLRHNLADVVDSPAALQAVVSRAKQSPRQKKSPFPNNASRCVANDLMALQ